MTVLDAVSGWMGVPDPMLPVEVQRTQLWIAFWVFVAAWAGAAWIVRSLSGGR